MTTESIERNSLVSVITLSYNYARFLPYTIEAVLSQTHSNIQHIIIDDGSTDNSVDVARTYARGDKRIEVIALQANRGACAAYAEAYKRVKGEFVCSIDADDVPHQTKFRKQLDFFKENPEYDLLSTYIDVIDGKGNLVPSPNIQQQWVNQDRNLNDLTHWLSGNYVAHSAVMMKRHAHDSVGTLDPNMIYAPDYEHFTRFMVRGYKIYTLPEELLSYRVHNNNITHKNPEETFIEFSYIFWKWIMPVLVRQRRFQEVAGRLSQIVAHDQYAEMSFERRMRLLSVMTRPPSNVSCYKEFRDLAATLDLFSGNVLEAALSYSPASLEFRSMLQTNTRLSATVNRLISQMNAHNQSSQSDTAPKLADIFSWFGRLAKQLRANDLR